MSTITRKIDPFKEIVVNRDDWERQSMALHEAAAAMSRVVELEEQLLEERALRLKAQEKPEGYELYRVEAVKSLLKDRRRMDFLEGTRGRLRVQIMETGPGFLVLRFRQKGEFASLRDMLDHRWNEENPVENADDIR